jgi:pimeloyl-ACP methyl ester carboxylesterase
MPAIQVICLPGAVAPAAQRYAPLKATLQGEADLHLLDLEVYRGDKPPDGYSVEVELAAIDRFAASLGLERFHLLGYSGGGFISLAYSGTRPGRLMSLALFEAAAIPGQMTADELAFFSALQGKLRGLDGAAFMSAFVAHHLKPGVPAPPPPGSPAPGMQKRPAGIAALTQSFVAYQFDRDRLRAAAFPVYVGYGDLTHEIESVNAGVLASLFADVRIQRHPEVHHFAPPEQIYNPAHVNSLRELWQRAERSS